MRLRWFKVGAALVALFLLIAVIGGCGSARTIQNTGTRQGQNAVITDMASRQVKIPIPAKRIVAIGPGALRLVCYAGGAGKVVGVENMEKQQPTSRPYILAYSEFENLPAIGQGGPDSTPDAEKLVSVKPDVIFVSYLVDKAKADELQAQTNIPVVVLSYGNQVPFDEDVYKSIRLIGKVIGNEQRAEDVVAYLKECQADILQRTKEIPEEKKPTVYVGALGMKGVHGIESTAAKYGPFVAIGARNVVDETGRKGSLMIEKEKLLAWDPEIIFIDEGGLSLVRDDYRKNRQFYLSLKAFKNGKVYGQMPFNYYTTNIDTAIADAYYAGKVIFPDRFQDVDPAKKADEIYKFLLGKPVYQQMAKGFGGFIRLDLSKL